eukprot:1960332-Prymnesium_polylepis.1
MLRMLEQWLMHRNKREFARADALREKMRAKRGADLAIVQRVCGAVPSNPQPSARSTPPGAGEPSRRREVASKVNRDAAKQIREATGASARAAERALERFGGDIQRAANFVLIHGEAFDGDEAGRATGGGQSGERGGRTTWAARANFSPMGALDFQAAAR